MTAKEMVAQVKNLPPVSRAALKLVALLDKPDGSTEDVVQVLKQDSVLTAKLLRACNSPAFALEEPVSSVDQAVLILGYGQILQMITALAFGGPMSMRLPGYDIEATQLWRHSLMAASAAEVIVSQAQPIDGVDASMAFTVGLLHDIGKLVFNQYLTTQSQSAIRRRIAEGLPSPEAEREVFGTDHPEVGACLLRQWRLSAEIVEAVENHHQPRFEPSPSLSVVTHFADCIAHLVGAAPGWEAYANRGSSRAAELLNMDSQKTEQLILTVCGTFQRTETFMNLG